MNSITITVGSLCAYGLALAAFVVLLRNRCNDSMPRWRTIAVLALLLALTIHGGNIETQLYADRGWNLSFFVVLSFTAWVVNLLALIWIISRQLFSLTLLTIPFALICITLAALFSATGSSHANLSHGMKIHIFLSLVGYSFLGVAAIQSLLLLLQEYLLRHRKFATARDLFPSMETMESALFHLIWLGYILLTLSLLSGYHFLEDIFAQHLVHKTVLSIIAWLLFSILLWGRWKLGWRGKTAVIWTISGFALLILAYFGTKMVLELILPNRGT